MISSKWIFCSCFLAVSVLYFLAFLVPIDLFKADLGRHLVNGRLFWGGDLPFYTNFYSYTASEFPTINHHWLYGVFIYGVWELWGFQGTTLVTASTYLFAALLVMGVAWRRVRHWGWVVAAALVVLAGYAYRVEVRPESLSMLFLAIMWFWVDRRGRTDIPWRAWEVLGVLLLALMWVNAHLFFVLGWMVLGVYAAWEVVTLGRVGRLSYLLIGVMGVSIANPSGIWGVLEPFMIFKEYGYDIAENQTVFFIYDRFRSGVPLWFGFMVLIYSVSAAVFWRCRRDFLRQTAPLWIVSGVFLIAGMAIVRLIPYFALAFLPLLAVILSELSSVLQKKTLRVLVYGGLLIVLGGLWLLHPRHLLPIRSVYGAGVYSGTFAPLAFMNQAGIRGPIFNNYDIGGYLILTLFPKERVFVDNRPEAYSVPFFKNRYIAMQQNEQVWSYYMAQYDFQSIIFDRRDLTPWAQPFLIRRLQDPLWVPVYVDHAVLILVRYSAENAEIIEKFALPMDLFDIKENRSR